jgi:neutral ceramidase
MGYSFAAGTTDGAGAFDFTQGTTSGNPFWDSIAHTVYIDSRPYSEVTRARL